MRHTKLSFKEKLEYIDTILNIILSIAAIVGFIITYESGFIHKFKEVIYKVHKIYVQDIDGD